MNTSETAQRFNVNPERRIILETAFVASIERYMEICSLKELPIVFSAGQRFYDVYSRMSYIEVSNKVCAGLSLSDSYDVREMTFFVVGSGFEDRYFVRVNESNRQPGLGRFNRVPLSDLSRAIKRADGGDAHMRKINTLYNLRLSYLEMEQGREIYEN